MREPSKEEDRIAREIVDAALFVHRAMGAGLFESVYEICLADELERRGYQVERQKGIPVYFNGRKLEAGFKADLVINGLVLIEIKSSEKLSGLQEAQVLTYLKLSGIQLGILINFNVKLVKDGIRRFYVPNS